MSDVTPSDEKDACPECGSTEWATYSDGLGDVASVAAACLSCGYLTSSWVDLGCVLPPALTDLPKPKGNHCPGCGWSSGGHDPRCPIPPGSDES